jgi:predicted nucleotidyltransferase
LRLSHWADLIPQGGAQENSDIDITIYFIPLYDPKDILKRLKQLVAIYPPASKEIPK